MTNTNDVQDFVKEIKEKNPYEPEFQQAVTEVAESVIPYISQHEKYKGKKILLRMTEPERSIIFRVPWVDDMGEIQVNRGFRIQMNSAIGPYKGGLRFHPTVSYSILKFLAFEQTFKNSLTTLPLGGGKGGADFDPKGRSEGEIMRFCYSYMNELYRYIGNLTDVPAGDIGVGAREVGYMFGQYKKIVNEFSGVLTGKGLSYGGSLIRPEATGYGVVYFADYMLNRISEGVAGKEVIVSGSGNVAQYVAEKSIDQGARVLTLSDSDGYIFDKDGMDSEKLAWVKYIKNEARGRISEYVKKYPRATYVAGKKPWNVKGDIAFPCATQNELDLEDAKNLVKNGLLCLAEGANMPLTPDAFKYLQAKNVLYAPGKASKAGGVAVSGLEMSQNAIRMNWTTAEVDVKLKEIMGKIHETCVTYGMEKNGNVNYVNGANIGGFVKVADAMLAQGVV